MKGINATACRLGGVTWLYTKGIQQTTLNWEDIRHNIDLPNEAEITLQMEEEWVPSFLAESD